MVVQSCCVKHLIVVAISTEARANAARSGHPSPAVVTHEIDPGRTELVARGDPRDRRPHGRRVGRCGRDPR